MHTLFFTVNITMHVYTQLHASAPAYYELAWSVFAEPVTCMYFVWQIKGYNSSITTIMCQVGSYRTVVGWLVIEC